MNCTQVREHLSDILDGNTPPLLAPHLEACGECAALVAALRQDKDVLLSMSAVDVPPILLDKVMNEVTLTSRNKKAWRFFVPRLAPVAAALALTVLSYNLVPGLLPARQLSEPPQVESADATFRATAEDTQKDAQKEAQVFATTEQVPNDTILATEGEDSRPWLITSLAGSSAFLLWSGVVYWWYKRREAGEVPSA